MDIARSILLWCERKGYSQRELERLAGVSQGLLSRYTSSSGKQPSRPTQRKIADALQISLSLLAEGPPPAGQKEEGCEMDNIIQEYHTKKLPLVRKPVDRWPIQQEEVVTMVEVMAELCVGRRYVCRDTGGENMPRIHSDDYVVVEYCDNPGPVAVRDRMCVVRLNGADLFRRVRVRWAGDAPMITLETEATPPVTTEVTDADSCEIIGVCVMFSGKL